LRNDGNQAEIALKRFAQNGRQPLLDDTAVGVIPVIVVNMKEAATVYGDRKACPPVQIY